MKLKHSLGGLAAVAVGGGLAFSMVVMPAVGQISPPSVFTLNIYYLADSPDGEPRADDDVDELRWFLPTELPTDMAFPHSRQVLDRWRTGLERA